MDVVLDMQKGTKLSEDAMMVIALLRRARARYEGLEQMLFEGIIDARLPSDECRCSINDIIFIRTEKQVTQEDGTN